MAPFSQTVATLLGKWELLVLIRGVSIVGIAFDALENAASARLGLGMIADVPIRPFTRRRHNAACGVGFYAYCLGQR